MKWVIGLLVLVFGVDQGTKLIVQSILNEGEKVGIVEELFNIWYLKNEGMVFGLLKDHPHLIIPLSLFALITIILLSCKWIKDNKGSGIRVGVGLILGGASGNLFDRVLHGGVIDFLDIGIGRIRWPTFNIADICICIGAGILIYWWYKEKGVDRK